MFDQPPPGPPEGIEKLKDVEFEVFREEWNTYRLEDGTLLKNRVIMMKIMVDPEATEKEKNFTLKPQMLTSATIVPSRLKGTPDRTVYPPPELLKDSQRLDFDTIEEEWNEYTFRDKSRLRVKVNLVTVRRSPKYNADGDPAYLVETSNLLKFDPPE